ncbi:hypothetical protein VOLCADRAFT_88073 [Volvox carteri f. nagariensis]|uniref:Protein kinase domain-containing protein n=1 Tax=Volvox carteri f. nagariensis TaxID=3068 RepID=D8TN01_VOLCA|nr:uncharacterized protein VOLCADRAFT_88073 [Volvox carteri f. nagariensis]EFJ51215.1 hypothetical protein VOLCADRAFT_88073 [Volvox carteri f. nagariensis]|eukprot:XP_002947682.1 hypothetical protein VOLCADRAFT_88073 [Volvox carteri f. nagariensis]
MAEPTAVLGPDGLEIKRLVGRGAFAQVFEATYNGRGCALKVFAPAGLQGQPPPPAYERLFLSEAALCSTIKHRDKVVGAMALRRQYSSIQGLEWLRGVAEALDTLHKATPPIIHRDIKADNVMLKKEADGQLITKLGDMGLHVTLVDNRSAMLRRRGAPLPSSDASSSRSSFVAIVPSKAWEPGAGSVDAAAAAAIAVADCVSLGSPDAWGPLTASQSEAFTASSSTADRPEGCTEAAAAGPGDSLPGLENCEKSGDDAKIISAGNLRFSDTGDGDSSAGHGGGLFGGHSAPPTAAAAVRTRSCDSIVATGNVSFKSKGLHGSSESNGTGLSSGSCRASVNPCTSSAYTSALTIGCGVAAAAPTRSALSAAACGPTSAPWSRGRAALTPAVAGAAGCDDAGGGDVGCKSTMDIDHMRRIESIRALLRAPDGSQLPQQEGFEWVFGLTGHAGSFMYMPPEIYRGEPYNEKVDTFSFGCLAYEVLARELLLIAFINTSRGATIGVKRPVDYARRVSEGYRPPRPERKVSEEQWTLVSRCWHQDPCERPSMTEVLQMLGALLIKARARECGISLEPQQPQAAQSQKASHDWQDMSRGQLQELQPSCGVCGCLIS